MKYLGFLVVIYFSTLFCMEKDLQSEDTVEKIKKNTRKLSAKKKIFFEDECHGYYRKVTYSDDYPEYPKQYRLYDTQLHRIGTFQLHKKGENKFIKEWIWISPVKHENLDAMKKILSLLRPDLKESIDSYKPLPEYFNQLKTTMIERP